MKVLVTGGAGFIGSHVVDALRDRRHEVVVVDSLDPGVYHRPPDYLRPDVDYIFADLRHWRPDARVEDVQAVVHLAALGGVGRAGKEPGNVLGANVGGTVRLRDLARGWPALRKVVLASSFSVYGNNYAYRCTACGAERDALRDDQDLEAGRFEVRCSACGAASAVLPVNEETVPDPLEGYGASKYMQELVFRGFREAALTIFRFSSVYGPRMRLDDGEATIIARIAGWITEGRRPTLFEDGNQIRDWVFVGDVADAIVSAVERDDVPSLVNVCSGVPTTLREACIHLANAIGVPDIEPEVVGGFRRGDMRHCLGDPATFTGVLGRSPLPFVEGAVRAFAPGTDRVERE